MFNEGAHTLAKMVRSQRALDIVSEALEDMITET